MNRLVKFYYFIKPLIPRSVQIWFRRQQISRNKDKYTNIWPIHPEAGKVPENFKGWPHNKKFAVVLSHDIDTLRGFNRCLQLMALDKQYGFCASFNFIPERYPLNTGIYPMIRSNGFEVAVHGLHHDGKLFQSYKTFHKRAQKINEYLNKWQSVGFNSPAMHHNLEWIHELNILYDCSTFDTDPFEPQPVGCQTIFPFWVDNPDMTKGFIELPYTLPQDFTLFILMQEKSIDIWRKKIDWIAEKGGMLLLNTHPDYINFGQTKCLSEEYPARYYESFLRLLKEKYSNEYWNALPRQVAEFWKQEYVDRG